MVIPERTERKYEPYPEYKDSGVGWLGEIPDEWDARKLKYVGQAILGLTYQPSDVVGESQGTLVLRSSNIQNGRVSMQDNVYVKTLIPEKLITRIGDILICSRNGSRDLIGKNAKIMPSAVEVTFGAFMTVFRSEICDYLYYVFNSQLFNYELGAFQTSTINQLTLNSLNSFQVPLPSIEEQNAIIDFLDHETARIDELISKKQKLIDLLQEQRTALITHTVTKGLNPDVSMKDSGVEWLGYIPAHWEVKKLKYVLGLYSGNYPPVSENNNEGLYPIFGANGIIGSCNSKNINQQTIVIGRVGASGEVHISPPECWVTDNVLIVKIKQLIEFRYGFYLLRSLKLSDLALKNAQPLITGSFIKNIIIGIPPTKEQQTIADYLDKETARIDNLASRINQAIEKLQEYRSALITAAVTGKIDVREQVS